MGLKGSVVCGLWSKDLWRWDKWVYWRMKKWRLFFRHHFLHVAIQERSPSIHLLKAFYHESTWLFVKAQCTRHKLVCSCRFLKMAAEIKSCEHLTNQNCSVLRAPQSSCTLKKSILGGKIMSPGLNLDPLPCGGNTLSSFKGSSSLEGSCGGSGAIVTI